MRHFNIKLSVEIHIVINLPPQQGKERLQVLPVSEHVVTGPGSVHGRITEVSLSFTNLSRFSHWPPLPHNLLFSCARVVSRERSANPSRTTCGLVPQMKSLQLRERCLQPSLLQNVPGNWLSRWDSTEKVGKARNCKIQRINDSSCLVSFHFFPKIYLRRERLKYYS